MSASLKKKLNGDFSRSEAGPNRKPTPKRLAPSTSTLSIPQGQSPIPFNLPQRHNDGTLADELQAFQTGINDESGRIKEFSVSI
jgi:hypothetical protein